MEEDKLKNKPREQKWFREHSLSSSQFQELIQGKIERAKRALSKQRYETKQNSV